MTKLTPAARSALFRAFVDYLLVILPIGIYVAIEAVAKNDLRFFFTSPEWAIAVIFLCVQGLHIYGRTLIDLGTALYWPTIIAMGVVALACIVFGSINAYMSVKGDNANWWLITLRVFVFAFVTISFIMVVAASVMKEGKRIASK